MIVDDVLSFYRKKLVFFIAKIIRNVEKRDCDRDVSRKSEENCYLGRKTNPIFGDVGKKSAIICKDR